MENQVFSIHPFSPNPNKLNSILYSRVKLKITVIMLFIISINFTLLPLPPKECYNIIKRTRHLRFE